MPRIVTFAKTAALWSLWVLCILLILPVLLSVPGKPTDAELGLYLAVLLSVTGYPVVLPFLAVLERGARRRSNQAGLHVIRIAMWGSFLAVLAALGTLGASFYAHERAKPVLSRDEIIEGSYPNAILMDDTEWMDRLMKEGASVDHRLPTFN
ncbi:hypothetical protein [Sphingomonas prati]|uniref:Uncharacterized protein n=1 Tax=Sphingomonas prati TaxID=1843237 RepID=A0A7W9F1G8_9SPHN|nr:hypothetical protein [Sphingomonas prati]MBB5727759.1 hypothetical protein [Sphingomonas prati]GGE80471.1 hypothetical protein GCM10011404_11510 [Sphingomonas prati]